MPSMATLARLRLTLPALCLDKLPYMGGPELPYPTQPGPQLHVKLVSCKLALWVPS